jgi:hypothetical protein
VETYPVDQKGFLEIAQTINKKLVLRGAWFFQVKHTSDGEPAILEIAPRVAGASALTRNLGVNLPLLSVYDRLGKEIGIQPSKHFLEMDRALTNRFKRRLIYEHVYVDLDDTLIFQGHVNVVLVSFLYQCLNQGVKRHLISRNSGDINGILRQYCLESLFDTVIQIEPHQRKFDFISEAPAIFIDDSYSERHAVAEKLGITTFDLDSVESLLDEGL